MTLAERQPDLEAVLAELAARHNVPGASVAVMQGDEVIAAATGRSNVRADAPMKTDTPFLIGSITKVWTATLMLSLVDEGRVDLDAPVREYLAQFRLADEDLAASVTVRHLLTHTDGIDASDYLLDFGRGADALELYVASLESRGRLFDPGAMWSYCNAAYCLAGRIVEVLTDGPWSEAVRERLIEPLGLTHTLNGPEDALLHGAAVGHFLLQDGRTFTTPTWMYADSIAPAGATLCCSASDLLAFGRMHLDGGVAPDGTRILSEASTRTMATHHIDLPYPNLAMGVGWWRSTAFGQAAPAISHAGGSPGGVDHLILFPQQQSGFVHFTNIPGAGFQPELDAWITTELLGIDTPASDSDPAAGDLELDLDAYAGVYERCFYRQKVEVVEGHLTLTTEGHAGVKPFQPFTVGPVRLEAHDSTTFYTENPSGGRGSPVRFLEDSQTGRPRYLHTGARAHRRVD